MLKKKENEKNILHSEDETIKILLDECIMYPWYRDTQIGVGQFCSPATIKTETGYNDCMLALDYAASAGSQSKVSEKIRCESVLH